MGRPKLKSDDEVLDAANAVLKRRGPLAFALSDVGDAVGLSRAALIQRFTNKETLLLRMMERDVARVREGLARLPAKVGPQGVWELLQVLVRDMGRGYDFTVNALITWYETQVPQLRKLAARRARYVQDAIRQRLPEDAPPNVAVLLHSVIIGACMQWVVAPRRTLADVVLEQVAQVLRLLFPNQTFD